MSVILLKARPFLPACDKNLHVLISKLRHDNHVDIEWFESNVIKLNQDKCHLLLSLY